MDFDILRALADYGGLLLIVFYFFLICGGKLKRLHAARHDGKLAKRDRLRQFLHSLMQWTAVCCVAFVILTVHALFRAEQYLMQNLVTGLFCVLGMFAANALYDSTFDTE